MGKWHEVRPKCKDNCRFSGNQGNVRFPSVSSVGGVHHQARTTNREKCEGISVSLGKIHPPLSLRLARPLRPSKRTKTKKLPKKNKKYSDNFAPITAMYLMHDPGVQTLSLDAPTVPQYPVLPPPPHPDEKGTSGFVFGFAIEYLCLIVTVVILRPHPFR